MLLFFIQQEFGFKGHFIRVIQFGFLGRSENQQSQKMSGMVLVKLQGPEGNLSQRTPSQLSTLVIDEFSPI